MSDVRLTATNPEDSSVVPVACNAKGELKLEEPIAPPEFDGNLDGDLTVTGSASFGGTLQSSGNPVDGGAVGFSVSNGKITITRGSAADLFLGYSQGDTTPNVNFKADGSATFAGRITSLGLTSSSSILCDRPNADDACFLARENGTSSARINADGSASFDGQVKIGPDRADNGTGLIVGTAGACQIGYNGAANFSGDVIIGSRSKRWMLVEQGGLCHMVEQVRATTADLVDPAAEYPKLRDVFKELNTIERCLEEVMTKLRMTEPDGWPVWDGSDNSQ